MTEPENTNPAGLPPAPVALPLPAAGHGAVPPARGFLRRLRLLSWMVGVGALAVVAVGWSFWSARADLSTVSGELTYRVPRGDVLISFTERGNVKASKSVPIYSAVEGTSTIVSVVPEGTFAKAGDLLVELDSSELAQLYNQ